MTVSSDPSIIDLVKDYIIEKEFRPGEQVDTEEQLAKLLNVSNYQIKKAFNSLAAQDILTRSPRRGTHIKEFDPVSLASNLLFLYRIMGMEVYEQLEARVVIETAIAPLVVRRISPAQISELETTVEEMRKHASNPQLADKADRDFHIIFVKSSGNTLLSTFSMVITHLFEDEQYRKEFWKTESILDKAEEHQGIIDAIKSSNTDLCVSRLRQHFPVFWQKIEDESRTNTD
jgi:GntR family transcriptional regulator, transcriptional repressor for pyruvate dehydrogenase complex